MYFLSPTRKYINDAKKLNKRVKAKLETQHKLLEKNPFHPSLHTKPLQGKLAEIFSFRVGRDYRGLFTLDTQDKTIVLLRIGLRAQIYKK